MTRRALLAALSLALAFTAGLAIGRAGAAVPSHPVYVGPYTRVESPIDPAVAQPAERHLDRDPAVQVTGSKPVRGANVGDSAPLHRVSGVPTYYCRRGVSRCTHGYPDGPGLDLYAAAGPSLRVGAWRGRVVTVCARVCLRVRLIDACACDRAMGHFLDLYHDAWVALGMPRRATVTW